MQCFQGTHLVIALAVGVPALLAAVAYPLALWGWLHHHSRKGHLQQGTHFWASFAHMWAPYRKRLYAWGSVREGRKLALLAIVLGLRVYGGLAQMLGGAVCVVIALSMHNVLAPFVSARMAALQAGVLGAVLFTLGCNVLISVLPLNPTAQLALQICFVVVDGCLVLLLVGLLCWLLLLRTPWGASMAARLAQLRAHCGVRRRMPASLASTQAGN